jgi:hypothetical protein
MNTNQRASLVVRGWSVVVASLCCVATAAAQVKNDGHTDYSVGAFQFIETPRLLSVFHQNTLLGTSRIRAGDVLEPPVHVSDVGVLTLGQTQFDPRQGGPMNVMRPTSCERQLANDGKTWLLSNGGSVMVLKPLTNADQKTVAYQSRLIRLDRCTLIAQSTIQGEEVDQFFEFEGSASGWWLVGPDEGSVLISKAGRSWQKLHLPEGIANVLTARWRDDGAFWILANRLDAGELTPTLYQSANLGKSWNAIEAGSVYSSANWFAAVRMLRASQHAVPTGQ